ncbi:MAG: peptidoglycan editing factor PgeF [Legionella sp.]|nr:peptidoglycan editing factor PgeF [Legionella sp.]
MRQFKWANWKAPANISAGVSTRLDGFSQTPYESNNLGTHVGDATADVLKNRQQLVELLQLPGEPQWLNQTHSTHCIVVENDPNRDADAAITRSLKHPLVILTADCLPIVLCNQQGTEIAAIHAGWKGLVQGIINNTITQMHSNPEDLIAWIGPAICSKCYEVGNDVRQQFLAQYPITSDTFIPHQNKWLANLPLMAELIMRNIGVNSIYQSELCTFESENELYSYRKSVQTGRIGTLIWFNDPQPQD